jgi:hypothetical protein
MHVFIVVHLHVAWGAAMLRLWLTLARAIAHSA